MANRGRESEILNSVTPENTLRHQSYPWVILIASSQNINLPISGAHKIQGLTLKTAFN
jgi:hypothetical protein